MKCEICHKANAEVAITRGEGEAAEELYVCRTCAKAERVRRQKKSQRTRKVTGLPPGMSMSITEIEGDEPPPFLGAILNAVKDMVGDFGPATGKPPPNLEGEMHAVSLKGVDARYRLSGALHLEGLHLIGESESVGRALRALRMELVGLEADGVRDVGHVYQLRHADGDGERAQRVLEDLLREERNARVRLFEEMPRVFGDALCRALSILKNCRLLSPGEFFDLLSPLRLAAFEKLLDGITLKEIEALAANQELSSSEDRLSPEERDRADMERADQANRRFEDVMLNERAEEKFL